MLPSLFQSQASKRMEDVAGIHAGMLPRDLVRSSPERFGLDGPRALVGSEAVFGARLHANIMAEEAVTTHPLAPRRHRRPAGSTT